MAAIITNSATLESHSIIHRRQTDDLPAHVKGTAFFENHRGQGGQRRYDTGYYITTSDRTKCTVEFIHANNQDNWYSLEKNNLGQYITTIAKRILELVAERYLRYWDITDPQHLDYIDQPEEAPEASTKSFAALPVEPTEEQSPVDNNPAEEVTEVDSDHSSTPTSKHQSLVPSRAPSLVAHYDVESRAATPVSPLSPAAAVAPVAYVPTPVYHIPIIAQPKPVIMSAQASTTITGMQGAVPAAQPTMGGNGSLKGNTPKPFTGEHLESAKFLLAFKVFWASNQNNPQMNILLNRCYTFLTYLEGDQTEGWKKDQLNMLFDKTDVRVSPIAETDNSLWINLEKDFKEAFTNTNIKSDAYIDLKKLKQTDSLNKYISEFKRLVHLTDVPIDQHSILEIFKEGLHKGLVKSIINSHDYDPAVAWDFEQ